MANAPAHPGAPAPSLAADAGRVSIEVHDVAPATWRECASVLRTLDDIGAKRLTLLVVPRYHRGRTIDSDPRVRRVLERRLERGDELALHGYSHLDEQPPPRTVRGYVERRLLTRAEGEFAAIDEGTAAWRLERGVETFHAMGWPLYGFVPPAWLLGDGARDAVSRCGHAFEYVAVRRGVYRLPDWRFARSATVAYSPDRAWRRAMSRAMIRRELKRARSMPLLRLAIHPQDARVPEVMNHWCTLVEEAMAERTPVTKHDWARTM
jgi:predicted deacetylase